MKSSILSGLFISSGSEQSRPMNYLLFNIQNTRQAAKRLAGMTKLEQGEYDPRRFVYFEPKNASLLIYSIYDLHKLVGRNMFLIGQNVIPLNSDTSIKLNTNAPGRYKCTLIFDMLTQKSIPFDMVVEPVSTLKVTPNATRLQHQVVLNTSDISPQQINLEEMFNFDGPMLDSSLRFKNDEFRSADAFIFTPRIKLWANFQDESGQSHYDHVELLNRNQMIGVRNMSIYLLTRSAKAEREVIQLDFSLDTNLTALAQSFKPREFDSITFQAPEWVQLLNVQRNI